MIRKIMQTAAVFLLTGVLAVMAVTTYVTVPDEPAADEETQAEEAGTIESVTASSLAGRQDVYVTVLGDSIAKGYSGDENVVIEPYSSLAMRQMAAEEEFQYEITNYARNGLDSAGMNDKILTDAEVCDSVGDRTLYLLQSAPMTFSTNARALCRKFSIQIRNSRAPVKR